MNSSRRGIFGLCSTAGWLGSTKLRVRKESTYQCVHYNLPGGRRGTTKAGVTIQRDDSDNLSHPAGTVREQIKCCERQMLLNDAESIRVKRYTYQATHMNARLVSRGAPQVKQNSSALRCVTQSYDWEPTMIELVRTSFRQRGIKNSVDTYRSKTTARTTTGIRSGSHPLEQIKCL